MITNIILIHLLINTIIFFSYNSIYHTSEHQVSKMQVEGLNLLVQPQNITVNTLSQIIYLKVY